jgi:hypothetical protein
MSSCVHPWYFQPVRAACALAAASGLALLAGCGGSSGTGSSASGTSAASPAATTLSLVQACKVLRSDVVGRGGKPDMATLDRIVEHGPSGTMVTHAKRAQAAVQKNDPVMINFDMALLARDCRSTGVQVPIPQP